MPYYYRSHETTHVRAGNKIKAWFKRAGIPLFFVSVVILSTLYLILPKGEPPLPETTYHLDEMPGEMPGDLDGGKIQQVSSLDLPGFTPKPSRPAITDPWELRLGDHLTEKVISVSRGDTLINMLQRSGLTSSESFRVVNSLNDVFDPRRLRQGQALHLLFDESDTGAGPVFQGLRLKLSVGREVQLVNCTENGLMAREYNLEFEIRPVAASFEINSSLYQGAVNAGIPVDILMQAIRAYSFDVDFQRDIRPGDHFEVMYESKINQDGIAVKSGSVLFAALHTRGRALPVYRYETSDGETDYFDAEGKSVRKTLMVTPIDGARISSGYGMRRHPIQGYNRMHRGLDFAAPTGTPIMAAGDGIVEHAGRKGSYGHYIRIRHPNEYQTVYAHMSRYGSGIRSGVRVRQGQIIGYVGSTGASTGPHLHYEVLHRGRHVNPSTVKTPPGRTLTGDERGRFKIAKADIDKVYASLEETKGQAQAVKVSGKKDG